MIELILVNIWWPIVSLTSWILDCDHIFLVAMWFQLLVHGWSQNSHLCGDQWKSKLVGAHAYIISNVWVCYKTHTWFIVSILFSNMWRFYLFITINATHLKKHVAFLEVNEVYDTTCENNYVELHYWTFKKTPTLTTLSFTFNSLKWTSKIPTPLDLT
jgi:hypothetical protein